MALPNGLKSGPRLFTKLMRVLFSALRRMGLESSTYLDDIYLQGNAFDLCQTNILTTARSLGKFVLCDSSHNVCVLSHTEANTCGFPVELGDNDSKPAVKSY